MSYPIQARLGPDGGTISAPDGFELVVPAGALAEGVEITVHCRTAPELRGRNVRSRAYELWPLGLALARPAVVHLPVVDVRAAEPAAVWVGPDPADPDPGTGWHPSPNERTRPGLVATAIDSLGSYVAA